MAKVYALIDYGWNDIYDSTQETENYIGIFTSPELATKAANDFLKSTLEWKNEKEYLIIPDTPLTFDQLSLSRDCDGYEYLDHTDYYGASLYIQIYELDKYEFKSL